MGRLDHLWRAVARAPVLSGVRAFWDDLVGRDAPVLRRFLRALPDLVSTYPCPTPGADGCPRGVVVHGDGDIVAVCRAIPRACETLSLNRADLVAYELDLARVAARVRILFGLAGDGSAVSSEEPPRTVYVGAYRPVAGHAFPAYLVLAGDAEVLRGLVEDLLRREVRPFILLAPSTELLDPRAAQAIAARGSLVLGLDDITGASEHDDLVLTRPAAELLAPFREVVMREAASEATDGMVFFPTPAGARWNQVDMRFVDSHTVRVSVGDEHGVFHYAQMGMASRKNSKPTVQWELLEAFAQERGTLRWDSSHASRKNQKRRELLANNLRAFFRIPDDPFEATTDGGWRARFRVAHGG
jgi:hypothetical protein